MTTASLAIWTIGHAGVSSSGQTDSGVSARMCGSFLAWLDRR
jgi:hypothetical protein